MKQPQGIQYISNLSGVHSYRPEGLSKINFVRERNHTEQILHFNSLGDADTAL